jgi:hypothetical protein
MSFRTFLLVSVRHTVIFILLIAGVSLLMLLSVGVLNAELYGRLTETQAVGDRNAATNSEKLPMVRLVLHRMVPDENAVEASIIVVVDSNSLLATEIRSGKTHIAAIVRDGSTVLPFAVHSQATLDASAFEEGVSTAAAQSSRFLIPVLPTMGSYPFDDLTMRPIQELRRSDGFSSRFTLEVQKALPGRLLTVSGDPYIVEIGLTRTPVEKAFVVIASLIFFILSLVITVGLFLSPRGLTSLEELVAVAGYLVAAAGFRELLGVSRVAGTSILEFVILGVPLVLLAFGVAVSVYRSRRSGTQDDAPADTTSDSGEFSKCKTGASVE